MTKTAPPVAVANLLAELPTALAEERFEVLASGPAVRIERIVSPPQATPGEWYDQDGDEWVVLLAGGATLEIAGRPPIALAPGDHLVLPAHQRHRVLNTAAEGLTVWLAVHYSGEWPTTGEPP
jgi:cupin 2 domain-containing protein